jgi:stringent starvation protein B
MSRRKKNIRPAITDDGRIYLRMQDTGIHPLVLMCDGVSLTFFGKKKQAYLPLEDVIAWYEREARHEHAPKRKAELEQCASTLRAMGERIKADEPTPSGDGNTHATGEGNPAVDHLPAGRASWGKWGAVSLETAPRPAPRTAPETERSHERNQQPVAIGVLVTKRESTLMFNLGICFACSRSIPPELSLSDLWLGVRVCNRPPCTTALDEAQTDCSRTASGRKRKRSEALAVLRKRRQAMRDVSTLNHHLLSPAELQLRYELEESYAMLWAEAAERTRTFTRYDEARERKEKTRER